MPPGLLRTSNTRDLAPLPFRSSSARLNWLVVLSLNSLIFRVAHLADHPVVDSRNLDAAAGDFHRDILRFPADGDVDLGASIALQGFDRLLYSISAVTSKSSTLTIRSPTFKPLVSAAESG